MILNNYKKFLTGITTYTALPENVSDLGIKTLDNTTISSIYYFGSSMTSPANFLSTNFNSGTNYAVMCMIGKDTTVTENDYNVSSKVHGWNVLSGSAKRLIDENGRPYIDRIMSLSNVPAGTYTSWGIAVTNNYGHTVGDDTTILLFKGLLDEPITLDATGSVSITVRIYL